MAEGLLAIGFFTPTEKTLLALGAVGLPGGTPVREGTMATIPAGRRWTGGTDNESGSAAALAPAGFFNTEAPASKVSTTKRPSLAPQTTLSGRFPDRDTEQILSK